MVCIMLAFPPFSPACSQAQLPQTVRGLIRWSDCQHSPLVDVVKLVATPWAPVLVAISIFAELAFAVPHCIDSSRDGSVVSCRDERLPSKNGGNSHNVDIWILFLLIQQPSPALACLAPPRGNSPVKHA